MSIFTLMIYEFHLLLPNILYGCNLKIYTIYFIMLNSCILIQYMLIVKYNINTYFQEFILLCKYAYFFRLQRINILNLCIILVIIF
jgi:hypothetical protein